MNRITERHPDLGSMKGSMKKSFMSLCRPCFGEEDVKIQSRNGNIT